ncbi:hypothetical protein QE152_g40941 [Popillia japonica]|uniref:Uncharacterized protein n=1 Tax=Popillia japonica TaxID=7064 RepID=A0AAW1HF22_POPJA
MNLGDASYSEPSSIVEAFATNFSSGVLDSSKFQSTNAPGFVSTPFVNITSFTKNDVYIAVKSRKNKLTNSFTKNDVYIAVKSRKNKLTTG